MSDPSCATNGTWDDEPPLCHCGRDDRGRDGHEFEPGCDAWDPADLPVPVAAGEEER
jgi:hypothetical protein